MEIHCTFEDLPKPGNVLLSDDALLTSDDTMMMLAMSVDLFPARVAVTAEATIIIFKGM